MYYSPSATEPTPTPPGKESLRIVAACPGRTLRVSTWTCAAWGRLYFLPQPSHARLGLPPSVPCASQKSPLIQNAPKELPGCLSRASERRHLHRNLGRHQNSFLVPSPFNHEIPCSLPPLATRSALCRGSQADGLQHTEDGSSALHHRRDSTEASFLASAFVSPGALSPAFLKGAILWLGRSRVLCLSCWC